MSNELKKGIKEEREHKGTVKFIREYYKKYKKFPTDEMVYKHIAKDHIKEDKKYYTKLKGLFG